AQVRQAREGADSAADRVFVGSEEFDLLGDSLGVRPVIIVLPSDILTGCDAEPQVSRPVGTSVLRSMDYSNPGVDSADPVNGSLVLRCRSVINDDDLEIVVRLAED